MAAEPRSQGIESYGLYGVEATHGTAVAASTSAGYVTDASVSPENDVRIDTGLGDQAQSRYGKTGGKGSIAIIAQDNQKTFAGKAYRTAGVLPSLSLEAGTTDQGQKLVGSKCESIKYSGAFDKALALALEWLGLYVTKTAGGTMATLAGDVLDGLTIVVTGGFAALQVVSFELGMNNGIEVAGPHCGSRSVGSKRRPIKIVEGIGESDGSAELLLPYTVDPSGDEPTVIDCIATYTVGVNTWVIDYQDGKVAGEGLKAGTSGVVQYAVNWKGPRGALTQT